MAYISHLKKQIDNSEVCNKLAGFFSKCMEVYLNSLLGQMTLFLNHFNNSLVSSTFIFRYRTNCFPSYQFLRCEMKPPRKYSLIWPVSWSMIHKCIQSLYFSWEPSVLWMILKKIEHVHIESVTTCSTRDITSFLELW